MRASDGLGVYGEQVAARHLVAELGSPSWRATGGAPRARSTSWRRMGTSSSCARSRPAQCRLRGTVGGGDGAQGAPAAPARGGLAAREPAASVRGAGRRRERPGLAARWPADPASARGGLMAVGPDVWRHRGGRAGHGGRGRGAPVRRLAGVHTCRVARCRHSSKSRDRVRAAVVNSGEEWPTHRVTVSLSPAMAAQAGKCLRRRARGGRSRSAQERFPWRRSRASRCWASLVSMAGFVRCAASCPPFSRPPGTAWTASSCRQRIRPKPGWCRASRCTGSPHWRTSLPPCAATPLPEDGPRGERGTSTCDGCRPGGTRSGRCARSGRAPPCARGVCRRRAPPVPVGAAGRREDDARGAAAGVAA